MSDCLLLTRILLSDGARNYQRDLRGNLRVVRQKTMSSHPLHTLMKLCLEGEVLKICILQIITSHSDMPKYVTHTPNSSNHRCLYASTVGCSLCSKLLSAASAPVGGWLARASRIIARPPRVFQYLDTLLWLSPIYFYEWPAAKLLVYT
jgi:hypothetical protein